MAYTTVLFHSAIVAVGSFNPAIYSPDWLLRFGLIGEADALAAKESKGIVVSHQITRYETEWFSLQVLEDQLSVTGRGVITPALKDLAVGIFQLLPHVPVSAIGLNFMGHYKIHTYDDYHKFGDVFAPKGIWNGLFPDEKVCGLLSLTMLVENGKRGQPPKNGDQKRVSIQQSTIVDQCGIHLALNDHREAVTISATAGQSSEWAAKVIQDDWDESWTDSSRIFDGLLAQALGS